MGKESIPAQFFNVIFVPKEEYGLENLPQESTIHKKYSEMSADMSDYSPHAGKKRPCQQLRNWPCPSWDPQLSKIFNSNYANGDGCS